MRVLSPLLCLAAFLVSTVRAADVPVATKDSPVKGPQSEFVVGLSPFLDASAKDPVYRSLVQLIVEGLPLDSSLEVYDAYNLKSIARVLVPAAKVFNSPKTRANQFAMSIGDIKRFLAQLNTMAAGAKPGSEAAIRLPQFCDFLDQNRAGRSGQEKLNLLLIGSPLYQDAKEPDFSMLQGYFPSDGHLRASREESVYGFNPGSGSAQGPQVYWVYFGDPWISDLHREKVTRFWALYMERRNGGLASFSSDLATAFGAFSTEAPGVSAASKGWTADPLQTEPEMLRVTRSVELTDWLTGDARSETTAPPSHLVGPMKIGIRWKQNIDLDLYAAPRRDAETLFFQHPRSPEGYYFKDHRSSPGHEYEFIEFEAPVDVRHVRAFVNFYAGSCPGGPTGEVRIEFLNRIYRGTFAIESPEGNQGRAGAAQSAFWAQIPVQEILRLDEAAQTASAAR